MARAAPCHSLPFPHSIERYQDAETAALPPTRPRRAETRLFPRGVLASFRPSTYRSKPTGGNVPIRSHLIEASGSSEAWYVPPRALTRCGLVRARRVLARQGWAGEKVTFLSILGGLGNKSI